jgi:hypothetical protein
VAVEASGTRAPAFGRAYFALRSWFGNPSDT